MTFFSLRSFALRASKLREAGLTSSVGASSGPLLTEDSAGPAHEPIEGCTFCDIAAGRQEAHVVFSDADTMAFLDVYPIRPGHTLVVPRKHCEMLSDLSVPSASALGVSVSRVARAVGQALGDNRLQVCANQVHAQTVPHAHYHIVPAPPVPGTPAAKEESKRNSSSQWFFSHGRTELDDEELDNVAKKIRQAIQSHDNSLTQLSAKV